MHHKLVYKYLSCFTIIWLLSSSFVISDQKTEIDKILGGMLQAIKELKTYKYEFKSVERIKGKNLEFNFKIKVHENPYKVYLLKSESGQEILFEKNKNGNNALVNPNGFPYVNLNLSPYGDILRKDAHHTLFESSFAYFGNVIEQSIKILGDDFYKFVSYKGEIKCNNKMCHHIVLDYPAFKYVNYSVQEKETLLSIAKKLNLSEYMILEKNNLSGFDAVKKGQVIKVPNLYAKKIVLYVDKVTKLSVNTVIYDDLGLFESYEYGSVNLNPLFRSDEFLSTFKEYHF